MSSSTQPRAPVQAPINWSELESIVTQGEVRDAGPADEVNGVVPVKVVEPATEQELAKALAWANENNVAIAARGGGTKLGWGTPPSALDAVISTKRLGKVLEHAWSDMTATVEAGCTIAQLQDELAKHGQRLAIDPLCPEHATIGGLIATNDSGALRLRYGSVRDLIIGITVALPDGTLAKSGGKVVKNVAGYDLPKLMTGALGTLGIITQATFRLHPLPKESQTLSFAFADAGAAKTMILAILDSTLVPTGVQLRMDSSLSSTVDVRLDGIRAGIEAQRNLLQQLAAHPPLKGKGAAPQASETRVSEAEGDVWRAREELWQGAQASLTCKLSVLPSQLAAAIESVTRLCSSPQLSWCVVAQATGLATLRIEAQESAQLQNAQLQNAQLQFALNGIRAAVQALGGTLVVLNCPLELKKQIDVWGPTGDAQPLMLRVKQQFDPRGILNRGRFVGGI